MQALAAARECVLTITQWNPAVQSRSHSGITLQTALLHDKAGTTPKNANTKTGFAPSTNRKAAALQGRCTMGGFLLHLYSATWNEKSTLVHLSPNHAQCHKLQGFLPATIVAKGSNKTTHCTNSFVQPWNILPACRQLKGIHNKSSVRDASRQSVLSTAQAWYISRWLVQ